MNDTAIVLREPRLEDGPRLWELIKASPPLDLNSPYAYLLMASHFRHGSVVAEKDDELLGAVTGYLRPDQPDTFFVWQVAVAEAGRGKGLAKAMILDILLRERFKTAQYLETTVTPSNEASRRLFHRVAETFQTECEETVGFPKELFGADQHEEEVLFRIGPLRTVSERVYPVADGAGNIA